MDRLTAGPFFTLPFFYCTRSNSSVISLDGAFVARLTRMIMILEIQKCREQFIEIQERYIWTDKVFPYEYHNTAGNHSCESSLPVGTTPE